MHLKPRRHDPAICRLMALWLLTLPGCDLDRPRSDITLLKTSNRLPAGNTPFRKHADHDAGHVPDSEQSSPAFRNLNREIVVFSEAFLTALAEENDEALGKAMLTETVLDARLTTAMETGRNENSRTILENIRKAVHEQSTHSATMRERLRAFTAKAAVNLAEMRVISVSPYGKELAVDVPFESFRGVFIHVSDPRTNDTYQLHFGPGMRIAGQWYFISGLQSIEKLDTL